MRKFFFALFVLVVLHAGAQAPQGLNYQAIARSSQGNPLTQQAVAVRFSILDATITGPVLYQETHAATTNQFGLFTLVIGGGTATSGTFNTINWASGNKFLKVEISPDGSANYLLQGTTQFMSVPYALYAARTNLVAGNNTVQVNGNTVQGNYQAGTGVGISGNTISGAYTGSNGVAVSGSNITGNYTGTNGVAVAGSTISGAYTGTNGVSVAGSTISGNYTGSNGVAVTGSNIAGNYTGTNGVSVTGSTISGAYVAGPGVTITGNTISAPASSGFWTTDAVGIHNTPVKNVGIRTDALTRAGLAVMQENTTGNTVAIEAISDDSWHTAMSFLNTTVPNNRWSFSIGGSTNIEAGAKSFGMLTPQLTWGMIMNGNTGNVGLGVIDIHAPAPKSAVHVFGGDVNVDKIGSGIILKSPNGSCWRVTIDNAGNMVRTAITCP
jgi:hypothetical protein